jgi:serpin B
VVRADRPFAFAIIHRPTSIPLFVGRVVNPAA